ncbi:hypothetical protein [Clostridium botulinum]|nr:hypothetical protein [Clostridium botulinum]
MLEGEIEFYKLLLTLKKENNNNNQVSFKINKQSNIESNIA